jgi:ACS family D-galactonate transporter-like MFS transporter
MQPQTLTGQATLVTPSRKRFFIMVLLFITVVINYLDRSNLSIAAPALTSELGIDPVHVGLIFSAFGWTYAAMQIPGGWLVDRVPPRILYTAALLLWSIATVMLASPAASSRCSCCAWPSAPWKRRPIRSTAAWSRRGFPNASAPRPSVSTLRAVCRPGVPDAGTGLAAARIRLAHGVCHHRRGRHSLGVIWYAVYREPRDFKGANEAEIDLIREGGGLVDIRPSKRR